MNDISNLRGPLWPSCQQSESSADFRRRAMRLMQNLVPASGAFFCCNREGLARLHASRTVDGIARPVDIADGADLAGAFRVEVTSIVSRSRWVFKGTEFYASDPYDHVPYFRDNSAKCGFVEALIVFLHEAGNLLAVCGLEHRADEATFTDADTARLDLLAPFILAAAWTGCDAHKKEGRCLLWATDPHAGSDKDEEPSTAMERLSVRERETARLLVAGYSIVNITAILGLSENTVRTYARRLYKKLAVSNRADLVREFVTPATRNQLEFDSK
ncbi:helix-turn-helix transcriptional regulator [Pendulispora rubella]|uniref:Helix-turn-helix transcriptional regulator n=1 Tax=Pendulispora rubella TaxID=2741070 RepID=A0ABZ2L779_9BACT